MKTIPRATLLEFHHNGLQKKKGESTLDAIIRNAAEFALGPDENTQKGKIHGWTSARFDGDRQIDKETCDYGMDRVRLQSTEADRKVPASVLRYRVGREVEAQKKAKGRVSLSRKMTREIKEFEAKRLRETAPVSYSSTDLYLLLEDKQGYAVTTAAPDSTAMIRLGELWYNTTKSQLYPINSSGLCPKNFETCPREPLHSMGQSNLLSDRFEAGAEFLTWLVVAGPNAMPESRHGLAITTHTPCLLSDGTKIRIFGGELLCPEMREALLSGKMVRSVRIVVHQGDDAWHGVLDQSLSISQLEVPPFDLEVDPKRDYATQMREALVALRYVVDLYKWWLTNVRMDKKAWGRFAAECRTVTIGAIGSSQKRKQALARWNRSKDDVDKILGE